MTSISRIQPIPINLLMKAAPQTNNANTAKLARTSKLSTEPVKTAADTVVISASRTDRTAKAPLQTYVPPQGAAFKIALQDRIYASIKASTEPVTPVIDPVAPPIDELNPDGGFVAYVDPEGTIVCGMPPRLPDGTILPYGGDAKDIKTSTSIIDTSMPQCPAAETI